MRVCIVVVMWMFVCQSLGYVIVKLEPNGMEHKQPPHTHTHIIYVYEDTREG